MRIDRTEEQRKRRAGNFDPALLKHGKASTYTNYSCRCDECREAATRWSREWRQKNPEKAAARRRKAEQWKRNNPERAKEYQVRGGFKKYGLTESNYLEMLKKQGGTCAICDKEQTGAKRLAVDHCHKTGVVRGLLCVGCNTALGAFGDDVEGVMKVLRYLNNTEV